MPQVSIFLFVAPEILNGGQLGIKQRTLDEVIYTTIKRTLHPLSQIENKTFVEVPQPAVCGAG